MVNVFCMNPDHYWVYRSQLEKLLRMPMERMNTFHRFTIQGIRKRIESRKWQVWLSVEHPGLVMVATFIGFEVNDDESKDMRIFLVGGKSLKGHLEDWWSAMKVVAWMENCNRIVGAGRRGWTRVLPGVTEYKLNRFEVSV